MCSTFCQAGGTIRRMARIISMPPAIIASSMLSMLMESEPVSVTSGRTSSMFGISGVSNV